MDREQPCTLPTGVRAIRRVEPPDAPWPALIARMTDESACLVVDGALLTGWPGWNASPDGHVLGARDVLRRPGGHDVVLPLCTERTADLVDRWARAGAEVPAGEVVTLAVSLLRGVAETHRRRDAAPAPGGWWLTDDGRPVFVHGDASTGCAEEAVRLLRTMATVSARELATVVASAADAADVPRSLVYELPLLEERLFACAVPAPLGTVGLAPLRARMVAGQRSEHAGSSETAPPGVPPARSASGGPWRLVAAHLDAGFVEILSKTGTALWRRLTAPRAAGRTRPLLVAALVGVIIVGVGLLWPRGPNDSAAAGAGARRSAAPHGARAESGPPAAGSSTTVSPAPDDAPGAAVSDQAASPPVADGDDLVVVAGAILERRRACHGDAACLAAVQEHPEATYPPGSADLEATRRRVSLVDDLGGVAVLRVEAPSGEGAAQLLTLVRVGTVWMLRDVRDVGTRR